MSKPRTREIIRPEPRRFLAISPVKLDLLRVACDKCGRGRYQVQRLINDRGRDSKIVDCWVKFAATALRSQHAITTINVVRCPDLAESACPLWAKSGHRHSHVRLLL